MIRITLVHKMQGWDSIAYLGTKYLVPYGIFCVSQDLYTGLADVTLNIQETCTFCNGSQHHSCRLC